MTGQYEKGGGFPHELRLDDAAGPAAHLPNKKADALISEALLAAGFGEARGLSESSPAEIAPLRRRRAMPLWQVAAAVLLALVGVGSASAAVMWWAKKQAEPSAMEAPAQPKLTKREKPRAVEAPPLEPEPITLDAIEVEAPPMPHKTRSRKPEDWLEDGNHLRAQKAWRDADESYARAIYAAPQSSAAYVARVASAGLHLDHLRDPRGALGRYRGALKARPNGPLSEEARYGIAECYRALRNPEGERAALEEFVQKHPDAGLAAKARRRILELRASD